MEILKLCQLRLYSWCVQGLIGGKSFFYDRCCKITVSILSALVCSVIKRNKYLIKRLTTPIEVTTGVLLVCYLMVLRMRSDTNRRLSVCRDFDSIFPKMLAKSDWILVVLRIRDTLTYDLPKIRQDHKTT